jgi:hypothetical protein
LLSSEGSVSGDNTLQRRRCHEHLQGWNKEKIFHFHNLLRISGTGGTLRLLYAAQLETWLKAYMGVAEEDYDFTDFEISDNVE